MEALCTSGWLASGWSSTAARPAGEGSQIKSSCEELGRALRAVTETARGAISEAACMGLGDWKSWPAGLTGRDVELQRHQHCRRIEHVVACGFHVKEDTLA